MSGPRLALYVLTIFAGIVCFIAFVGVLLDIVCRVSQ
jgi:hypothetical protein